MIGTAGDARMNSYATFSYGLLHMDIPVLADRQGFTLVLCGHRMQPRRPAMSDG